MDNATDNAIPAAKPMPPHPSKPTKIKVTQKENKAKVILRKNRFKPILKLVTVFALIFTGYQLGKREALAPKNANAAELQVLAYKERDAQLLKRLKAMNSRQDKINKTLKFLRIGGGK